MTTARTRIFSTALVTLTAACGAAALLTPNAGAFVQATSTSTTPSSTQTTPTPTTPTTPGAVDTASDLAALTAYRSYLQSLVDGVSAARGAVQSFVTGTADSCEGALTPVTEMAKSDVSEPALTALGQEIGSDLWLSFSASAVDPFTVLSGTLAGLPWTRPSTADAIDGFISAERTVMAMAPSNLCKDALLLAAKPTVEPVTARSFLRQYLNARVTLKLKLGNFLTVLERYQTPAEAKLVVSIDKLASQFDALALATQHSSATTLLTDLGI